MSPGPDFQPENVIRLLGRHEVRYVVIGGLAAVTHGAPLVTQDVEAELVAVDPHPLAAAHPEVQDLGDVDARRG